MALKNKDEWLDYLIKNLKTLEEEGMGGDSDWAKFLLNYINDEKQNFITTKFKGELFNIKYVVEKNQPLMTLHQIADEVDKITSHAGYTDTKPNEE